MKTEPVVALLQFALHAPFWRCIVVIAILLMNITQGKQLVQLNVKKMLNSYHHSQNIALDNHVIKNISYWLIVLYDF